MSGERSSQGQKWLLGSAGNPGHFLFYLNKDMGLTSLPSQLHETPGPKPVKMIPLSSEI